MNLTRRCPECDRVFDLTDEDDAEEWSYGHDCEPEPDDEHECCSDCGGPLDLGGYDGRCGNCADVHATDKPEGE